MASAQLVEAVVVMAVPVELGLLVASASLEPASAWLADSADSLGCHPTPNRCKAFDVNAA